MKERTNEKNKYVAAFMMVLFSLLFCFSIKVHAAEPIQCGDNVYATLDEVTGTLTISGTGDMWDAEYNQYFYSIREDIYKVVIESGVTSIGNWAFGSDCDLYENIVSVSIGPDVKHIGKKAFYGNQSIKTITIPGNVQVIDECAFLQTGLTTVNLNEGLIQIGTQAFHSSAVRSIVIPEGTTTIEEEAFYASSLGSVTIPKSMVIIKAGAFGRVSATIKSNSVTIAPNAFEERTSFTADRGSTTDEFVKTHSYNYTITYNRYPSTLTYNANGGTVSTATKQLLSETPYGNLATPQRKGYTFEGWYTSPTGGRQIQSTTLVTITKNSTVYAHWKAVTVAKASKPEVTNSAKKEMTVSVKAVSGAAGYQIRYATNSSMSNAVTATITGTKKVFTNLSEGKKYFVQVKAYKLDSTKEKIYGSWSDIATVNIQITVAKASKPSVKNSAKKEMTVSVKSVTGAKGYQIRYATNSSMNGAKTATITGTKKVFTNLSEGKTYYVQVRAYKLDSSNRKVYGSWSDTTSVYIKITVGKASKPGVTNSEKKTMTVNIKSVYGAKGYQVRYATNSSMNGAKTVTATNTKKTITNLTKGKMYYVQVRAYKLNSYGEKVYGEWSDKATVTILK